MPYAIRDAMTDCRTFARLEELGYTDELAARYGDLRKYFPAFLRLPFRATRGGEFLLTAIEIVRAIDEGASDALLRRCHSLAPAPRDGLHVKYTLHRRRGSPA